MAGQTSPQMHATLFWRNDLKKWQFVYAFDQTTYFGKTFDIKPSDEDFLAMQGAVHADLEC